MFNETQLQAYKAQLRGALIQPGDADYDASRKVYNAMIDKRPRLIARCADVADVIASVNFAREHALLLAVRGGAHNGAGLGVCDDGLVLDLSALHGIRVDPRAHTMRVEGGCTWGDVDHATHAFGLATPAGIISTTGVGGLTLGGGIGHLSRRFGLTIDNLLSVDMVLANGQLVTAGSKENEELFWAVRGGGGNFGVVTRFDFEAHPLRAVVAADLGVEGDARPILRAMRELMRRAPHELTLGFMDVPAMDPNAPAGCRSPLSGRETTRRRPGKRSPRSWRPRESSNERPASVRIRRCFRRCRSSIRRRPRPASPEATPCCVSSTTS